MWGHSRIFLTLPQSSPSEVLDAISEGVDLFDCSYVGAATSGGYALSFPILRGASGGDNALPASGAAAAAETVTGSPEDESYKVNLWSLSHR